MMQKMLKKKKKRDERVLRNLDDEVFRIAPKERMGGAEGRDARSERRRINREKDVEKGMLNRLSAAAEKRADLRKKTKDNMRKRRQSQKAIY